jgi:hypothetical protein
MNNSGSRKRERSDVGGDVGGDDVDEHAEETSPAFFVVVLTDVYGSTDDYPICYAPWDKLTSEERIALFRSIPDERNGKIQGCDATHDFGEGYDANGDDHVLENNIWSKLASDEKLSTFTRKHHCEVTVAYYSQ